jgi:hypothetical protein
MMKKKESKIFIYLFIIFMFVFGIYFMYSNPKEKESFVSGQCQTTIIKDGQRFLLYNPELDHVPGVNPIELNSLNEYKEYIEWQRANKIKCPILHLEKVFDSQGAPMYEIRPSFVTELNVGGMNHNLPRTENTPNINKVMDAALLDAPFNCNQYAPYDKENQNIGIIDSP